MTRQKKILKIIRIIKITYHAMEVCVVLKGFIEIIKIVF